MGQRLSQIVFWSVLGLASALPILGDSAFAEDIVGGSLVVDKSSPEFRHSARLLVSIAFAKDNSVPSDYRGKKISFRCSATIVGQRTLVTASHCFPKKIKLTTADGGEHQVWVPVADTSVRVFYELNPREDSAGGELARSVVRHPQYADDWYEKFPDAWNPRQAVNDIAMVQLESDIPSHKAAAPLGNTSEVKTTAKIMLTGYGRALDEGPLAIPQLRKANVPFRGFLLNQTDFFAGAGNPAKPGPIQGPAGGCFGDSGGGSFAIGEHELKFIGVIVRGPDNDHGGCQSGLTILTDLQPYLNWITHELEQLQAND